MDDLRFLGAATLKCEGWTAEFDSQDGSGRSYRVSDVEAIAEMIRRQTRCKKIKFRMRDEAMRIIDYVRSMKPDTED